jgi:serine/threonine-protein kinase
MSSKIAEEDRIFSLIVLKNKLADKEQVEACLRELIETTERGMAFITLGEIMISEGILTQKQVKAVEQARNLYLRSKKVEAIAGYKLIRKIGEGGMGQIYEARQLSLDRRVAIKVLPLEMVEDDSMVRRFEREAKQAARLSHNNIIPVYDFGKIPGEYYMVMEYVDGYNLEEIIERKGRLSERSSIGIVRQIGSALEYSHSMGVIHRDLKPNNIMISRDGKALLADLGLAKRLGSDVDTITKTGVVLGTPSFMSPEQIVAPRSVGPACDIYGLGVSFACMVSGHLPFDSSDTMEIVRDLVDWKSPVKSLLDGVKVSPSLRKLILKMAAGRPEKRHANMAEVLAELDAVEKEAKPPAEITVPKGKRKVVRPLRRKKR